MTSLRFKLLAESNFEGWLQGKPSPSKRKQVPAQFAQTISEPVVQVVHSFRLKVSKQLAERDCTNCLRKLSVFGRVLFWV